MAKHLCLVRAHLFLGLGAAISAAFSFPGSAQVPIASNIPNFARSAARVGAVDPATVIDVSIWLKPHNKAGLDALVQRVYNRDSSSYHHWLTPAQLAAEYAPSAGEAETVGRFLSASGLKVSKVGPNNFYVRATGTVAAVSAAFHVTLSNYKVQGNVVRANQEDPSVSDGVAPLVESVSGLDSMGYTHPYISQTAAEQSLAARGSTAAYPQTVTPVASAKLPASSFNSNCFPSVTNQTFTTDGSLPKATYSGNEYTSKSAACGYTPENLREAYGLNPLYNAKFDGTGQTISIIDWCGSPTITADANAFSAQFGLPKLTSANFNIIYTPSPSYCEAPDPEINIDVEWAHAIAPGAAIDLIVPPSSSFQDVDQALFYAVNYQLGNVISGSYASEESETASSVLKTEALITEIAAALGISANFATGDYGDYTFDYPQYYAASVSAPADSPYATAVGGVSLALKADNAIAWQTGWGTNVNPVSESGYVPDPPDNGFFDFGSGGGESAVFAKPAFQDALPGTGRDLPDVSWLADPFTGAYIAISVPFALPELQYEVYGGTSLACPMFSALWAIANQIAGAPLGQAAPYLYSMPAAAITDIVPVSSKTNVTGKVVDSSGTEDYSATYLAAPLENTTSFVSALWDYPLEEDTAYVLTFGTDSGLVVTKGWDNVTGVGVPKPRGFVDYFFP